MDADRQRIDKWLWHARVVRTRTAATDLVEGGHVRVNGERVRVPARPVRSGDVLTVALDRSVRILRVIRFSERRGGPADAEKLYETVESGPQQPEMPE